ncbi:hypothetical protein FJ692_12295 [Pseudomonas fluorescens]|uniref:Uncharacterized protein n=1 Tax=Pseudomonas azotoformans TaxID=47878 RepID=A0A4Q0HPQ4_PSEAZ|nr:hypothetical protein C1751_26320 [Pseudomonas fluorescens]RXE51077.1 hypothetical protein B4O85_19615 [Pseudomonas azotoformans]TPV57726.1 hypothetical protein FJ692_12295 [Pseudomonas fluorescens]
MGIYTAGPVARELAPVTAWQPTLIELVHRDPNVGAGLPAKTACQPTPIYLRPRDQIVGAGLPAIAA